jgi:hypothetical protein
MRTRQPTVTIYWVATTAIKTTTRMPIPAHTDSRAVTTCQMRNVCPAQSGRYMQPRHQVACSSPARFQLTRALRFASS